MKTAVTDINYLYLFIKSRQRAGGQDSEKSWFHSRKGQQTFIQSESDHNDSETHTASYSVVVEALPRGLKRAEHEANYMP